MRFSVGKAYGASVEMQLPNLSLADNQFVPTLPEGETQRVQANGNRPI